MNMEKNATTYYFPWVKKGLGNRITEEDRLTTSAIQGDLELARHRAVLFLEARFQNTAAASAEGDEKTATILKTKEIQFVGPGDITRVLDAAISKVSPKPLSAAMAPQHMPYIEFWEPDFPWRFSPVKPNKDNRIRPWLALLVCEKSLCTEKKAGDRDYVSFSISDEETFRSVFPSQEDSWKTAHAQGFSKDVPVFSRLLALRSGGDLKPFTDYSAFLVPAFETGRLAGLGCSPEEVEKIIAQTPAWESRYEDHKSKHPTRPFDFPVYASWSFSTGKDSFEKMAEDLKVQTTAMTFIDVDVTRMGEGVGFDTLRESERPKRRSIQMPAAVSSLDRIDEESFPQKSGAFNERVVYDRLKELLSASPTLMENKDILSGTDQGAEAGDDDPWVVPPVYGAKHILATSVDEAENDRNGTPWLSQVNLDIHYRAVAGIGKRIVQKFQEEFVNRAWKQVEDIQALNAELYRRLASANVTTSLQNKVSVVVGGEEKDPAYLSTMLQYFRGMPQTERILRDKNIPRAYASASFQFMTDVLARINSSLDTASVMQHIAESQIFKLEDYVIPGLPTVRQLREETGRIFSILSKEIFNQYLSGYFHHYSTLSRTSPVRNDQDFENGLRISTVPRSHRDYAWHYLRYGATRVHCNPRQDLCMEIYRSFFDQGFDRHGIPGSTKMSVYALLHSVNSAGLCAEANVVCIDGQLYAEAFGTSKGLTRVGGEDGWYFLSRKSLQDGEAMKVLYRSREKDVTKSPLEPFAPTPDQLLRDMKAELDRFVPTAGGGSAMASHRERKDEYERLKSQWAGTVDFGPNASRVSEGYDVLRERIYDYFFDTPVGFELDLDKYDKRDIQCFDTVDEYVVFLRESNDKGLCDYLSAWKRLDQCVKVLEARKPKIAKPQPRKPKDEAPPADDGFKDNPSLARAREVVSAYISEFFADTPEGKKLRDTYVDELLRSKFPVMAYPIFPEPTYHYLRLLSDKFILPCADSMPNDSVVVLQSNDAFVESFLCGMNTEMGRELLWREYPTDQRGSYFRKFWDSETSVEDIRNDNFFDVKPLHTWTGKIGENHAAAKADLLLFVIKGRLMRQYPMTKVYLHKAVLDKKSKKRLAFSDTATVAGKGIILPVSEAFLRDDIYVVGFKAKFDDLLGDPSKGDYGYMLTFEEDVQDLNFGKNPEEAEAFASAKDAAAAARILKNDVTLYGKHLSLFIPDPS
jgi:hypothetical protein